jgi:hypothetical protein
MIMNEELLSAIEESSDRLDIEPAALMAVVEVESAGRYFATVEGKKEPLIRFEGHYFDRRTSGSARARARLRGVSSPLPAVVKNPASQTARWALLNKAIAINRQAALESTSWGIGQVMGAHWKWLGYETSTRWLKPRDLVWQGNWSSWFATLKRQDWRLRCGRAIGRHLRAVTMVKTTPSLAIISSLPRLMQSQA